MSNAVKKIVLVIEDEEPILNIIGFKFKQKGFTVISARSADQALDFMNHIAHIDFIWLDHYLEGNKSGLEFVSVVKQENSSWSEVPIFLVSNTSYPDKHQAYIALGVEKYYTKSNHSLMSIVDDAQLYLTKNDPERIV